MRNAREIVLLKSELVQKQGIVDVLMEAFRVRQFPVFPDIRFDFVYESSGTVENIGGDWIDVFWLRNGCVAFSVGDVCGKGLGSAVKMSEAKQAIRIAALLDSNGSLPRSVLSQANELIFMNGHDVRFTTAVYGIIDPAKRTVTYGCAGHHPPVLACVGGPSVVLPNHGFALGVERPMPDLVKEHTFTYEPGMLLLVYTDGLVDFSHDGTDGERRLLACSRLAVDQSVEQPARFVYDNVVYPSSYRKDDIALLTILFTEDFGLSTL